MKKILAVSSIFFSVALSIIALAAPSPRSTLKRSKPSWATSKNYAGSANAKTQLGFRVYLGWNNASGAEALARAVSDPKNKQSYRHYLTPAQFRQQFAPTASQVSQVQNWLTSQGFTLVYTPANNHYVSAKGTIGQAQQAFGVSFGMYKAPQKLTLYSPSADVSIPSSLAGMVSGVAGLDQSYVYVRPNIVVDSNAPPSGGFRNSPPLSAYWAAQVSTYSYPTGFTDRNSPATAPWNIKGHTPADIKGAYRISGYTGTGQTVAITDAYASPTILQDANQWSDNRTSDDPTHPIPEFGAIGGGTFTQVVAPGTYNVPENPRQDPQGWYGEETLDVESVHGMAPNANVIYVGAPNQYQDLDAALNHVVDRGLAQIVSNSWGLPEAVIPFGYIKPVNDTLIQAAIEGIGVYFSSGDSGDETVNLGFASPDFPASSPWVTAVGGTALAVNQSHSLVFETGWDTDFYGCDNTGCTDEGFLYGSGGGYSMIFAQPDYQTNYGGNLTGVTGRAVPDVAAVGDIQTGYLIGQTQTFPKTCNGPAVVKYDEYRVGGTSLSCPIFAGIMALSDQAHGIHGFANQSFYQHSSEFTDITSIKTAVARRNFSNGVDDCDGTSDSLRTFDDNGPGSGSPTQSTTAGWDNVTGLGTPYGIPQ
jgi:subtilase family serine protease